MSLTDYAALGWALVPIPRGTKGPNRKGWNLRENCQLPAGWTQNVGLAHAYSGTCALDIDRLDDAAKYLIDHGVDLSTLLTAPDAVRIDSGRENRAKLLYKLTVPLPSKKLAAGAFELRCSSADGLTVQDVLPPSIHPETDKPYVWIGDYRAMPEIPAELLALWQGLAIAKERTTSQSGPALDLYQLRALVAKHDPDAPYDADEGGSWLKVGMAIHAATDGSQDGLALWDEWSAQGMKYEGRADLEQHWRSFKKGGVTVNWLSKGMAIEASDFSPLAEVDDISLEDDDPEIVNPPVADKPQPVRAAGDWPVLRRKKNGRIEPCYLNIHAAIRDAGFCGMQIGYDEFRAELMQAPAGVTDLSQLRPFGDNHYGELRRALEAHGFETTGMDNVRQAVGEVGIERTFDSARDWLEAQVWDGVGRVTTFLPVYFGSEDNEYTRAVGMYLWTALAGRIEEPACQADMALILFGKQGCRKSTSVAAMAPRPEQFVRLSLDLDDDDLARMMAGTLIGELPELRGLASKDLEAIKDFITGKQDKWVPKYKEFANSYPRRTILIGTTNKREFLADETGERRFLPVHVTAGQPEAIRRDLSQLWAEGLELWRTLGVAWQRAEALAPEVTKDYKITDGWEDSVAAWCAVHGDCGFNTSDVAGSALGIDIKNLNRGIEMRISKILNGLGYSKKQFRIDGIPRRLWKL